MDGNIAKCKAGSRKEAKNNMKSKHNSDIKKTHSPTKKGKGRETWTEVRYLKRKEKDRFADVFSVEESNCAGGVSVPEQPNKAPC